MTWKQKQILLIKILDTFTWDDFFTIKGLLVRYGLLNDLDAMKRYYAGCDRIGLKADSAS